MQMVLLHEYQVKTSVPLICWGWDRLHRDNEATSEGQPAWFGQLGMGRTHLGTRGGGAHLATTLAKPRGVLATTLAKPRCSH